MFLRFVDMYYNSDRSESSCGGSNDDMLVTIQHVKARLQADDKS